MKKISAIFWTLLFIIFAVYQTNDPDPIVWILIYVAAALISLLVILDKSSRPVLLIALIAFLAGAAMHWPDTFEGILLKEDGSFTPAIEEARESLGLLIAGLAMGWHLFVTRAKQKVNS